MAVVLIKLLIIALKKEPVRLNDSRDSLNKVFDERHDE